jgi:histone deacetylase 6
MTGLIIIVITFESFRCVVLSGKEAEDKYLMAVHSENHVNLIRNISSKQFDSRRNRIASKLNSIYFNEGSSEAAYHAAGSVLVVCFFLLLIF